MAHFAEIKDGKVLRVIVVHNNHEHEGPEFCKNLYGGEWVQTSYNNKFRKRFAGIGYTYDEDRDAFIAPKPFESWTLDESLEWVAPKPYPAGGGVYSWNEQIKEWTQNNV